MNTTTKYLIVLFVGMLLGVLGGKWADGLTEEAKRRAAEEILVEEFNDEDSISIRWKQNHFILNAVLVLRAQGKDKCCPYMSSPPGL